MCFFTAPLCWDDVAELQNLDSRSKSDGVFTTNLRITPKAVEKKFRQLNPAKAKGPDTVPPRVLKELSREFQLLDVYCSINP